MYFIKVKCEWILFKSPELIYVAFLFYCLFIYLLYIQKNSIFTMSTAKDVSPVNTQWVG